MSIKTRFAPSPTGLLHVGGARTALFSWLHARKHGGKFVFRIEDTDLERSTQEAVNAILESMAWLGLDYDEGPFYQTHRFERYKEVIQQLLGQGHAYYCYCSKDELEEMRAGQMQRKEKPRYDGRCRDLQQPKEGVQPVVRFRNPQGGEVLINDLIKGEIRVANDELDDLIIARSDGSPTYNLCVVVDDMDMGINCVIRGDDHVSNTPKQINILRALGVEPPQYAHVPMILGADGARLSKRHGAVGVMQYRDDGYVPEALLNYLARLGWSHGDQEIFSLDEMLRLFKVENVNVSASVFNPDKLLWLNHQYLMHGDPAHIARHLDWHLGNLGIDPSLGPDPVEVVELMRERCKTLVEMAHASAFFYLDVESYDDKAVKKHLHADSVAVLESLMDAFAQEPDWTSDRLHGIIQDTASKLQVGMGKVAQPLRIVTTGSAMSPSIDLTLALLGRTKTLQRLRRGIEFVKGLPAA